MSSPSNLVKVIKEGKAIIQVPKSVFYNPVQEFNRDLSVLVLRTYLKHNVWHHRSEEKHVKGRGGMKILDALSATGMRSIRYAKELGPCGGIVKKIVANDLSEKAVELIKKNIDLNNVHERVESSQSDATRILHMSAASYDDRFHVIDLDPFGTGAPFFDAALSSIGEAGLLMVTCTDTAVLCGNASETCFARYGSMSLRGDFCHEAALRIILKSLETHATVYGRYIKPLLSISVDFYVRLFVQVFTQQAETKKSSSKLSQIYFCRDCKTTELNPLGTYKISEDPKQAKSDNLAVKYKYKPGDVLFGDKCRICQGSYYLAGPIWSDPMHDGEFLELLKQELKLEETQNDFATYKRIQGIVHVCSEELPKPALFYSIDAISKVLRMKMYPTNEILSALVNAGYKASDTHTNTTSFKTDAPSHVVWDIFCQLADKENLQPKNEIAMRIMARTRKTDYNFQYNSAVNTDSKKFSMLRYQINPTKNWGPKPRPSEKTEPEETSESQTSPSGDNKRMKSQ